MLAAKVVLLIGLAAAGLTGASLGLVKVNWWKVTYQFTTDTKASVISVGPFQTCQTNGNCAMTTFSTTNLGTCTRDATTQQARIYSVLALTLLGGLMGLLGGVAAVPGSKGALVASCGLFFLGTCSSAVAMGLFYQTMESWLYCNTDFCSYQVTQGAAFTTCVTTLLTAPYIMQGFATILMFVGCAVAGPLSADVPVPVEPAAAPAPTSAQPQPAAAAAAAPAESNGTGEPAKEDPNAAAGGAAAEPAPAAAATEEAAADDDWVWDEEGNMYWSDSAGMYYDYESGWYYHPSGYWYDAETEEWVNAYPDE